MNNNPMSESPLGGMSPAVAALFSRIIGTQIPSTFTPLIGGALKGVGEAIGEHTAPGSEMPSSSSGSSKASQAGSELRSIPPGGDQPIPNADPSKLGVPANIPNAAPGPAPAPVNLGAGAPAPPPAFGSPEWYQSEAARIQGLKETQIPTFTPPPEPHLNKVNRDLAIAAALAGIFMKGAAGPVGSAFGGLERGMQGKYARDYQKATDQYQSKVAQVEAANKAQEFELAKELQLAAIAEKAQAEKAKLDFERDKLTQTVNQYMRQDALARWKVKKSDADRLALEATRQNDRMKQLGYQGDVRMQVAGMTLQGRTADIAAREWIAGLNNQRETALGVQKVQLTRQQAQATNDYRTVQGINAQIRANNISLLSPDANIRAKAQGNVDTLNGKLGSAITQLSSDSGGSVSVPSPDMTDVQTSVDALNAGIGQIPAAGGGITQYITTAPGQAGSPPTPLNVKVQTGAVTVDANGKPVQTAVQPPPHVDPPPTRPQLIEAVTDLSKMDPSKRKAYWSALPPSWQAVLIRQSVGPY